MDKYSVVFHPCENLENYVNNTYSYRPLYTHHFFIDNDICSALQWVRYDIYYIVDTFEMFIKVTGQVHTSKDALDIRKALYVVYKSIFMSIPENTLILDESVFKNLLYMRSMGTQKFIPPGRIIAEIPLDNSSIFQLRYCVFNEYTSPNTTPQSSVELPKNLLRRSSSEESNISYTSDQPTYFKNTLDKHYFDEELYNECYMNISHKGNFDNCLIYDIIKFINKSKKERLRSPRKGNTFDRLNFSNQENFNILHRRLEWFYHWFIEGASNIKPDSRWSVFIPLIIFTYDQFDNECFKTINPISKMLTSNEDFKKSISDRFENLEVESIRTKIMNQPLGAISDLKNFKHNKSPLSKKLSHPSKLYNVTILGMVTAYYFFTLNNDRFRISQFMIFPNYKSKGFGLWVLEFIYRLAIMDSHVREIAVEDPTPIFLVLRYVVALKLCFESGFIDPKILYGNEKNSLGIFKLFSKSTVPSRDRISSICKEAKPHSTKLSEILQLANMLPNPISNEYFSNRFSNKRSRSNCIDVKLSLFVQSDMYIDFCDKLKNKLKFEELKVNGKNGSLKKNIKSTDDYLDSIDNDLENMCNETISGYIRVINKLRKIFPNE